MDLPKWLRGSIPSLSSLASIEGQKYVKTFILATVMKKTLERDIMLLKECLHSIPPNIQGDFLEVLWPEIDILTYKAEARNDGVQNILLDFLLSFLTTSVTSLNVDKVKFYTRIPERFFLAVKKCNSINRFSSYKENIWKYSTKNFDYLHSALLNMNKLKYLTLRHLKIDCNKINELLLGLSKCCPGLYLLDLKYSNLADSGLDPESLQKFGGIKCFKDCIPALLKLKNLKLLNVSETWLTNVGVKAIVKELPLHRLDAIVDEGYDLQIIVIKDLMQAPTRGEPPLKLPRTTYLIARDEPDISPVCESCPDLQELILPDLSISELIADFDDMSLNLQHLSKISLCGLEWSFLMYNLDGFVDNPHTLNGLVKEVTLSDQSKIDALNLGCLSVAFPSITHLTIIEADEDRDEPWTRGPTFVNLVHLHFQASLYMHNFGPTDRLHGSKNILDVLLSSSHRLQSLTLYTSYLNEGDLSLALSENNLYNLKELRIGLQHELSINIFIRILLNTLKLEVLGRSDWWTGICLIEREKLKVMLQEKYFGLIIYGADSKSCSMDPRPRKHCSDGW
ncbi:unnamed protein product [Meganyctiphanes norvegica]|uniref:Uncharacterized protein n=1 Tax=Meganyctiphanes norvegica TaxID=48144 RepID=A0AAV2RZF5_MEGNR